MNTLLAVAAGGALGATSRYLTVMFVLNTFGGGFPWGTLTVNILGSFAMGVLAALFAFYIQVSDELKYLLTVGFLGSYTTFSTFSLDVEMLFSRGDWVHGMLYIAGSVLASIFALILGLGLIRAVVS